MLTIYLPLLTFILGVTFQFVLNSISNRQNHKNALKRDRLTEEKKAMEDMSATLIRLRKIALIIGSAHHKNENINDILNRRLLVRKELRPIYNQFSEKFVKHQYSLNYDNAENLNRITQALDRMNFAFTQSKAADRAYDDEILTQAEQISLSIRDFNKNFDNRYRVA